MISVDDTARETAPVRDETARRVPGAGRLAAALATSLGAGLLLYAIETADRVATLWPSFNGPLEPLVYAAYLAPTIPFAFAAGLALALVLGAVRAAHLAAGRVVRHPLLAGALAAVGLAAALWLVAKAFPAALEQPLLEVARKINLRVTPIPLVVKNFSAFFLSGLVAGVAALVATGGLLAWRPTGRGRFVLAALAALSALALVGLYALDSRVQFGRYELTLHAPAVAGQLALAYLTAGLALGAAAPRLRAWAPAGAALVAVALAASGFAAWHVGSNENLKALLWRRSVLARRAYEIAALAADRDGDGATGLFAGADLDDHDPAVHPFATEVPGNGVDENCFGGDATAAAWHPTEAPVPAAPTGYNFVLIALDTLRASRMSVYGYDRPTTPRIAEHAARGRFFARAHSLSSNTGLTFAAMQRSSTRAAVFGRKRPTLFRVLEEAGYRTAQINAASDARWLAPRTWRRYRKVIMDGIADVRHQEDAGRWDGDRVTDEAIAYLSSLPAGTRHATWVHYLDQHEPRRTFEPFDFGDSASDVYDSTVAFTDREVGRLLDYLRDSGALENTIVVLMADHGESFAEHGMNEHGNRPHAEQIEVPTIVWAPGVAPARVESPVTTVDIAPTVLASLGLPNLPGAEGVSLLGDVPADRPVFAETPANLPQPSFFAYAVTHGTWRLIYDVRGNTVELYDLARDPNEIVNLADAEPERLAAMKAMLAGWLDTTGAVRQFGKRDADGE